MADALRADPAVRAEITALAEREGWPAVHRELARVDPPSADRLKPTDRQRLQRALEVFRLTGRPLSAFHGEHDTAATPLGDGFFRFPGLDRPVLSLAVVPPRPELHRRIEHRFMAMLEAGLVEEVAALRRRGDLHAELPALKSVALETTEVEEPWWVTGVENKQQVSARWARFSKAWGYEW